jgi:hypothetical protein
MAMAGNDYHCKQFYSTGLVIVTNIFSSSLMIE